MSRKAAQNTQLAHSLAKVQFYETFLNKYLRMLLSMSNIDEVSIYDVFCGRGVYENGTEGSSLRALSIVNSILAEKKSAPHVTLYLNDIKREHTESVRNCINSKNEITACSIRFSNSDALELMQSLVHQWRFSHNYKKRNILFIDPYGYKAIDPKVLRSLVMDCHADVLLFLPVSFMYRFTEYSFHEDASNGAKPIRAFIESFFPNEHPIHQAGLGVHQYINYLTEAFSFGYQCYSASYHIERNDHNYFSLFYMSQSLMGFEKVIEAKWELDEQNGCGFKLPPKMRDLFEEQWKYERQKEMYHKLQILLIGLFTSACSRITNATIYKFVLQHEFLPRHAKLILSEMQKSGCLECYKMDTGEQAPKGSFYLNYRYYSKPCAVFAYRVAA